MNYYRFISKCIIALLSCIIGLSSCGDKVPANEIHYTTIDNSVLPIEDLFYFGEGRIVSNSYVPDKNVCILKLDKDVTEIGKEAFYACSSFTSITIPESVTWIGEYAFSRCSSLTSITIPESVGGIGGSTFSRCSSLTRITVSKDNKVYDSREDCNAIIHTESNTLISGCKNTTIPPSVTEIGENAFSGCSSLTSISIPPSVTGIAPWAFEGCSSLTSITIPPSVTWIGLDAFCGCSGLTSITIPPSVTEIGYDAFSRCSSLTSIIVSKDNKVFDSREDCNAIIHTESNTLIRGCENTIIPPSVTEIWGRAFSQCSSLTCISIPPSVTEIWDYAFSGCSSLTEVRIPKGCNVHEDAFYKSPNVQIIRY